MDLTKKMWGTTDDRMFDFIMLDKKKGEVCLIQYNQQIMPMIRFPEIIVYHGNGYKVTKIGDENTGSLFNGPNCLLYNDNVPVLAAEIPDSVTDVYYKSFEGTLLMNRPSNWIDNTFYVDNVLVTVDAIAVDDYHIIPGTRVISSKAFSTELVNTVYIPESVKYLGSEIFQACDALEKVNIKGDIDLTKFPKAFASIGNDITLVCDKNSVTFKSAKQMMKNRNFCVKELVTQSRSALGQFLELSETENQNMER